MTTLPRRPRRHLLSVTGAGIGTLATLLSTTSAFTTNFSPSLLSPPLSALFHSSALAATTSISSQPDVVVISPPGGIGEITSIEAARLGGSVKWFVVSAASLATSCSMTVETLAAIQKAGGSMEIAGASADSLLAPFSKDNIENSNSALSAMGEWCATPKSLICTYDGALEEKRRVDQQIKTPEQIEKSTCVDEEELIRRGIRAATREAVAVGNARKVAVLGLDEEIAAEKADEEKGVGGLLAGLFEVNEVNIPGSMAEAMQGATSVIRYGELFGAPESSPESSPFIGGPRRDPVVRDMYTMRSVRIDPTVSISGNRAVSEGSKSNRLAVGEAASRLGLGKVASTFTRNMDVSLTSFDGTEPPTDEEWNAEFGRAAETMTLPNGGSGAQLFSADFSSVPSIKRLSEWIAQKWAPAILRSYDIAGTRVGARPVYALQRGENTVEIVWQELDDDFNSVTSGKMIIEIGDKGMTASRGAGDTSKGFGLVSRMPLPGEDILVTRLADAASQAVGKGLAVKPKSAKKDAVAAAKRPVTTVAAAAATESAPTVQPTTAKSTGASGPGPRSAGAMRSSERSRGSKKSAKLPKPPKFSD